MTFESEKQKYLTALGAEEYSDRSKKGSVDEQVRPLLEALNARPEYYTTSSCAGRIVLLVVPASGRKDHAQWLYASHDAADAAEVWRALGKAAEIQNEVFFRQESAILHVCCHSIEDAQRLVDLAKASGLKHSGIMSTTKRIMVEVLGSENLDAPVACGGRILVDAAYLEAAVGIANARLQKTRARIHTLHQEVAAIGGDQKRK